MIRLSRLALLTLLSAAICVPTIILSSASAQEAEVETFEYTVQEGDTCAGISLRFFGNRRRYDIIHSFNPGMGPPPHSLEPGSTLTLPRQETTGPDARLTAARRQVQAREPQETTWNAARRGLRLFRGWRVNTLDEATAELTFRDTSVVQMRANTLVIIYGGESEAARRGPSRAELRSGALRSRLGTLRLQVDTPSAIAALDGGSSVISVDAEGASRVSNHEGGAASVSGTDGGRVRVRPGFGSKVLPGRRPARPRPLPPSPSWNEGPSRFSGLVREGGTIRGSWSAVDDARVYRVEVRQADASAVFAVAEVPANVTHFEVHRLPAGNYEVSVSTIDGDFFESRPSDTGHFEVALARVRLPGEPEEPVLPDPSAEPQIPTLMAGAPLTGDGIECAMGDSDPTALVHLDAPDFEPREVRCRRGEELFEPFTVRVERPRVQILDAEESVLEVVVGTPTDVRLSAAGWPEGTTVRSRDMTLSEPSLDNDVYAVNVLATAPGQQLMEVVWNDVVLGTATLNVVAAASAEPEPEPEPDVVAERPSPIGQDTMDQWRHGSLLGLDDPRAGQHAIGVAMGHAGEQVGSADGFYRFAATIHADIKSRARLTLGTQYDLGGDRIGSLGDRNLVAGVGVHLLSTETVHLYGEVSGWFPTEGFRRVLFLAPSMTLGVTLGDNILLRTRQAALIDIRGEGPRTWSSAYGADVRFFGPLFGGIELDVGIGRNEDELLTHISTGLALGLTTGPLRASLGVHAALTNDLQRSRGNMLVNLSVRMAFDSETE